MSLVYILLVFFFDSQVAVDVDNVQHRDLVHFYGV